jgi:hypothetical protein
MPERHVRIDTSRGLEVEAGDRRIGLLVGHERATALLSDDDFEALTDFVVGMQKREPDFSYLKAIAAAVKCAIGRGALSEGTVRITRRDIYLPEHDAAP